MTSGVWVGGGPVEIMAARPGVIFVACSLGLHEGFSSPWLDPLRRSGPGWTPGGSRAERARAGRHEAE
eukprot:1875448-Pyramimonas_sp.AAC.1